MKVEASGDRDTICFGGDSGARLIGGKNFYAPVVYPGVAVAGTGNFRTGGEKRLANVSPSNRSHRADRFRGPLLILVGAEP